MASSSELRSSGSSDPGRWRTSTGGRNAKGSHDSNRAGDGNLKGPRTMCRRRRRRAREQHCSAAAGGVISTATARTSTGDGSHRARRGDELIRDQGLVEADPARGRPCRSSSNNEPSLLARNRIGKPPGGARAQQASMTPAADSPPSNSPYGRTITTSSAAAGRLLDDCAEQQCPRASRSCTARPALPCAATSGARRSTEARMNRAADVALAGTGLVVGLAVPRARGAGGRSSRTAGPCSTGRRASARTAPTSSCSKLRTMVVGAERVRAPASRSTRATRGSHAPGGFCGASRSTSCRSSGTSSAAT